MRTKRLLAGALLIPFCASAADVKLTTATREGNGGPATFVCGINALAATLTQCQAAPAAGLKLYITDIVVQTTTATSGTYAIQTGTGANCVTGTAAVFPISGTANRFNAPINSQPAAMFAFRTPLVGATASAICVIGVATNTISIQISGFTAP